jgi:cytochrome c-type biogenesis protein CcsB
MNLKLFDLGFLLYLGSALFWLLSSKKEGFGRIAQSLFFGGFIALLLGMLLRWWETYLMGFPYPPLANMYESLVFFCWVLSLFYLFYFSRKHRWGLFGFLSSLFCTLLLLMPILVGMDRSPKPLVPALQSFWLYFHVMTCFAGYGGVAIGFLLSLIYLFGKNKNDHFWPSPEILEEGTYKAILLGFLFLSLGIITGAAWAHYAWGRYWAWDPKETWSLITWLIYAGWLHARFMRGWRGRRMAILSVIGFASVIFTYVGVNYLLSGLHSYG